MAGSRRRGQPLSAGPHLASLPGPALGAWCVPHCYKSQGYRHVLLACTVFCWEGAGNRLLSSAVRVGKYTASSCLLRVVSCGVWPHYQQVDYWQFVVQHMDPVVVQSPKPSSCTSRERGASDIGYGCCRAATSMP